MTTIYLIRHAESEGNLFRTCQGHYEELLSQTGLQQCKALHQRFRKISVDAVYTSDLYRAALTAQSVARAQVPAAPLYADKGLREKGLGVLEGKKATIYPGMEEHLAGAVHGEGRVVKDENIITSQGPGTAMDFALAIVETMCGEQVAEDLRKDLILK